MKDLIVLVADKNMQFALQGGLMRPESLGIRPISVDYRQHPGRDGGVRSSGSQILALDRSRFSHALMVFDYEGCGAESSAPMELEAQMDEQLSMTWGCDAKAIVIVPEVDVWMWGSDNKLREVLRWPNRLSIRDWLRAQDYEFLDCGKPVRPKEALEELFRACKRPRSSASYQEIAAQISLRRCQDPAFQRLQSILLAWFGSGTESV